MPIAPRLGSEPAGWPARRRRPEPLCAGPSGASHAAFDIPSCSAYMKRMTFAQLQGQARAIAMLRGSLDRGRVSHAMLFAGPDGVGKETIAYLFARGLLCDAGPRHDGCGVCPTCKKLDAKVHPDVHLLAPEKNTIPIEAVRALTSRLQLTAYEGRYKIAIIRDAHTLNPAAQNALLKTLEEPPGSAVLMLISAAPHLLLSTVRSRCQRVAFAPLERGFVRRRVAELSGRPPGDPDLAVAVALSEGSLGRALAILDEGRFANRAALIAGVETLAPGAASAVLNLAETWGADRQLAADALEILQLWYRDRLLDTFDAGGDRRCLPDLPPKGALPPDTALRALRHLHEGRGALLGNANAQLVLEKVLFAVAAEHGRGGFA